MASKHLFGSKITDNDSTAKEQLGTLRREYDSTNGFRTFKYIQASLASQTAIAAGRCLMWYDTKGQVATNDESTTDQGLPAGASIGALTHSYYGWIQVGGYHSSILTNGDGDISDGDTVICSSTDGKVDSVAAGTASTYKPLGIAVADDHESGTAVKTLLTCTYGDIVQ